MQSERIKEFLKYASPRLDYIEQCMEKQALSPAKIVGHIAKLRQSGRLSEAGKFKSSKKLLENQLPGKDFDQKLLELAVASRHNALSRKAPTSGSLTDARTAGLRRAEELAKGNSSKIPAGINVDFSTLNVFPTQGKRLVDSRTAGLRRAEELAKRAPEVDGTPKSKNAPKTDAPEPDAAPNATGWWNDATKNVSDWVGKHPAITSALTGVGGGALGGGIGYGIGSGSGQQDGFDAASAYYKMREALQRHNLLAANDNILSRLANVFGGGDLSNLIG